MRTTSWIPETSELLLQQEQAARAGVTWEFPRSSSSFCWLVTGLVQYVSHPHGCRREEVRSGRGFAPRFTAEGWGPCHSYGDT